MLRWHKFQPQPILPLPPPQIVLPPIILPPLPPPLAPPQAAEPATFFEYPEISPELAAKLENLYNLPGPENGTNALTLRINSYNPHDPRVPPVLGMWNKIVYH